MSDKSILNSGLISSSGACREKDQTCKRPSDDPTGQMRCCETIGNNQLLYCNPKSLKCDEYKPKYEKEIM